MSKRITYNPYHPCLNFTFDDTAFVMFHTSYLNYKFSMLLNSTFNLHLTRVDNMGLNGSEYPCFSYYDSDKKMFFTVIERCANGCAHPIFDYYDKMLVIRGRDAFDFQNMMFDALKNNATEPESYNLIAHRQWVMNNQIRKGIFDIDTFSFRAKDGWKTSLHNGSADTMGKAVSTYMKSMHKLAKDLLFETLYNHLFDIDYDNNSFAY